MSAPSEPMHLQNLHRQRVRFVLTAALCAAVCGALTGCSSPQSVNPDSSKRFVFPGEPTGSGSTSVPALSPTSTNSPSFTGSGGAIGLGAGAVGLIRVGDTVTISFSDLPPQVVINPVQMRIGEDGNVTLHLNQTVQAAGKTARALEQEIRSLYVPKYYNYMTVTVKTEERFYFVGGEVRNPNRVLYFGPITVLRAIDTAGGFTDFANRKKIELTRQDGKKIKINYAKAVKDAKLDPEVYPNDQILVPKRFW